jgi:hypothetical protein
MEHGELKVVLHLKDGRARIGVQEKGTDPVVESLEAAALDNLLAAVPAVVQRARERWAQSPQNPKYQGPPPPPATPRPTPTPTPHPSRRAQPREGQMTKLV